MGWKLLLFHFRTCFSLPPTPHTPPTWEGFLSTHQGPANVEKMNPGELSHYLLILLCNKDRPVLVVPRIGAPPLGGKGGKGLFGGMLKHDNVFFVLVGACLE